MSSPTVIVNSTPVVKVSYGLPGIGVPSGGVKPQVLKKSSSTDYDTEWGDVEVLMLDRTDLTFSGTLSKGDPVYVNSSGQIAACDASDSATLPPVGLVAGDVSASGDDVDVILIGAILESNTSSFSVGDRLYVAVSGGLTSTAPSGLNGSFSVGFVSKSDATEGIISVNIDVSNGTFEGLAEDNIWIGNASGVAIQYEHQLKRLTDVDSALAPSANQLLRYSGTQWEAVSLGFDDIPLTQLSEGHVYVGNSSNETTTTDTIYVDVANSRVGIGTTSPQEALHVDGRINLGATPSSSTGDYILIGQELPSSLGPKVVGVGVGVFENATAANHSVASGFRAARYQDGNRNVAVGYETMQGSSALGSAAGDENVAVGSVALELLTTGYQNVAVGAHSLRSNTEGIHNVAVGTFAGTSSATASYSTYVGAKSGYFASGGNNVAVGYNALNGTLNQSTFENTVAVGYEALKALTTGAGNTAVGYEALHDLTTGSRNTVLGYQAGDSLTNQGDNTVIGYQASGTAQATTAVGALASATGNSSVAIGLGSQANAIVAMSIGASSRSENVGSIAIGYLSRAHEAGVFVGYEAGRYNNGEGNTVIGYEAGQGQNTQNASGYDDNVLVGYRAGFNLEGGSGNVFIGYGAGHTLENDNHRLHITGRAAYPTSTPLIYGEFDNELVRINGDLDVRSEIISTGGDNIVLNPGGLANVEIGNYVFDGDQTVDQTTDNYVLTYDDATGLISLTENIIEVEGATTVVTAVRNDTGTAIPAGTALYSLGETAGTSRILVGVADASNPAKMPAIGIAATELGTTGSDRDGDAIILGDFDTAMSGYTGLDDNDILYVAGSGGGLPTNVKPTGTDLIQNIGIVLKSNGSGTQCQALKVSCIGRTNDVPNIQQNYAWIGNASGVATPTELETTVLTDVDSSASYGSGEVLIWDNTQSQFVSNNITGSGDITVTNGDGTIEIGTSFTDTHIGNTDLTVTADRELDLDGHLLEIKHGTLTYLNVDGNSSEVEMKASSVNIRATGTDAVNSYGAIHLRGAVDAAQGSLIFHEAVNSQTQGFDRSITILAPANLDASPSFTLPGDEPDSDGYVLASTTGGVMSWVDPDTLGVDTHIGNSNLTIDGNRTLELDGYDLHIIDTNEDAYIKIEPAQNASVIDIKSTNIDLRGNVDSFGIINLRGGVNSNPGAIVFHEAQTQSGSLDNSILIQAPSTLANSSSYTLPNDEPSGNGYLLSSTTGGIMSWVDPSTLSTADTHIGNTDLTLTADRELQLDGYDFDILDGTTVRLGWNDAVNSWSMISRFSLTGDFSHVGATTHEGGFTIKGPNTSTAGSIDLYDDDNSNRVTISAPASLSSNLTFVLPSTDGQSGHVLQTDGSGNLSFAAGGTGTGDNLATADLTQTSGQSRTYTTASSSLLTFETSTSTPAFIRIEDYGDATDTLTFQANPGRIRFRSKDASVAGGISLKEATNNGNNYITVKAPAQLTSPVTLTLPDSDGNPNQVLKTDGSGNLDWVDQTAIPALNVTQVAGSGVSGRIPFYSSQSTTALDSDADLTFVTDTLSVPKITTEQIIPGRPLGTSSAGTFGKNSQTISKFGPAVSVSAGLVYSMQSGSWDRTNAKFESDSKGMLAIAGAGGSGTSNNTPMVLSGFVKVASNANFSSASIGDPLYLKEVTTQGQTDAGYVTATAPSGTGRVVRIVGYVADPTNGIVYFNPDNSYIVL